jgi:hypothetical protein
MSSYYGDGARSAPSWDSLDAGYDEDVLDQSEVGDSLMTSSPAVLSSHD